MGSHNQPPTTTAAAGWYPDSTQPGMVRYFDGQQWTPQMQPAGSAGGGNGAPQPKKSHKARNILLAVVGVIVVIIIIAVAAGGGSKKKDAAAGATTSAAAVGTTSASAAVPPPIVATTAPATTAPANVNGRPLPIQSGDWRLDTITVKDDGLGDFGGTGRVAYTGKAADGGTNAFTLTVFLDGKIVATLLGSASSVPAGQQATVQFISSDKYVAGAYTFDFQKSF